MILILKLIQNGLIGFHQEQIGIQIYIILDPTQGLE